MWPSPIWAFGDVPCPAGTKCQAINCIFFHDIAKTDTNDPAASHPQDGERETKRVKLDDAGQMAALPAASSSTQPEPTPQVFTGLIARKEASPAHKDLANKRAAAPFTVSAPGKETGLPQSATRAVSPPPKGVKAKPAASVDPEVPLTPRKLKYDPAQFTKRLTLLKALRQYMAALNSKLLASTDPAIKKLHMTENQLNKLAVDEEASIGEKNMAVYENVLKQRLVALKKMPQAAWIEERKVAAAAAAVKDGGVKSTEKTPEKPEAVKTGLTPEEEVLFLSRLITSQEGLDKHGYVTKLPTEEELDKVRQAVAVVDCWEICDRCNTRFQVFPSRREDGALTTGGKCTHHWGKTRFSKKEKGQAGQSSYTCCGEPIGSPGCTTYDTHVFKITEPKRLSIVMPFVETPENDKADPNMAVCFDCEMGYTTQGLELLRLTAVSWPSHRPILDILVRPLGHVLDLNTRFSGVSTDQFLNAKPFDVKNPTFDPKNLRIVDSPYIARNLFLSLISPRTPILGHALENDLNTIRLIHPSLVDTIALYPHKRGLPYRHGLKSLVKYHLKIDIQTGGAAGHDSFEDARATGELIRHKVATEWSNLKKGGWTIKDGCLCPPPPPPLPSGAPPLVAAPPQPITEPMAGEKRQRDQLEEGDDKEVVDNSAQKKQKASG